MNERGKGRWEYKHTVQIQIHSNVIQTAGVKVNVQNIYCFMSAGIGHVSCCPEAKTMKEAVTADQSSKLNVHYNSEKVFQLSFFFSFSVSINISKCFKM